MLILQKLKNYLWHLPKALYYNYKYNYPARQLTIIGITGTDGKTTTSTLVYNLLVNSGYKCGLITTIGAKIGDESVHTGLHTTSPDPKMFQKLLRQMVTKGVTHVVVEVTAHALDQFRYHGCHYAVAAITNTSQEHLDDFQTMDNYIKTKTKIFSHTDFAVYNKDDSSAKYIKNLPVSKYGYSIKSKSDFQAKNITITSNSLSFDVNNMHLQTDSNYYHQVYNILTALAIATKLNIDPQVFQKTILSFPQIKGRREIVENPTGIKTIIDFAHTPAALKDTLESLKSNTPGRLIVIFGATGGRDKTKRPLMGKVVSEIADIAIITSDDTRNENVQDINNQIISGISSKNSKFKYFNIPNRQDAFNQAILLAKVGDTIVACGKGHETTILLGTVEYPWSEAEAFRTAFRIKNTKA